MIIPTSISVFATDTEEILYMFPDETYSFVNVSDETCKIYPGDYYSTSFDYIQYDDEGKISETGCRTSVYSISLDPGERAVISGIYGFVDVTYPKEGIEIKKENTECFEHKILTSDYTYVLKNISGADMPLFGSTTVSNPTVPFIMYDEEGNITEQEFWQQWSYSGKKVPAGYTIKIMAPPDWHSMKLSYPKGSFTFDVENSLIYETVTIFRGESFRFKNVTDKTQTLFSEGGERDWRLYDKFGNISEEQTRLTWGSGGMVEKEIPAGYTIEMSLTHIINVSVVKDFFIIEKAPDAKATRLYVCGGDTYSFTNITGKICEMRTDPSVANRYTDYAIFDKNNKLVSQARKSDWSEMAVNPGDTIKFTPRCRTMEIAFFEDEFDFEKESESVFLRNILSYGETYSFKNTSLTEKKIMSDSYGNYEIRGSDGNVTQSGDGCNLDGISVMPGNTLFITATGGSVECMVLRDSFVCQKISEPEDRDYIDLAYGKTYKITNNSTSRYTFSADDHNITHDFASYYKNGEEYGMACGVSHDITIYDGGWAYITVYANMSIYNSPNISVEEINTPVYEKKDLFPGKIYSFERLTDDDESHFISYNSVSDFLEYDKDGNVVFFNGLSGGTYNHNKRYVVKINGYYSTACYPAEVFKFSEETKIDLGVAEFNRGESVKMTTKFTDNPWMSVDGGNVVCAIYGSDDTVRSISKEEGYFSTIIMESGEYAKFTATGRIRIVYPTEFIQFEKLDSTPFEYKTISSGETVHIKQESFKDTAFRVIGSRYDYVKYDANGKITEYMSDSNCGDYYNTQINLWAGESIAITAKDAKMTVIAADDNLTFEKRDYPCFENKFIPSGGEYSYINPYDYPINFICDSYGFDYVIYDESYNIKKETSFSQGTIELKPQYRIEITNGEHYAIISLPYEMRISEDFTVNVTGVSISSDSLTLGLNESKTLTATIMPANATYKGIIWASSDTSVATVSSTGTVKGKKHGSTVITATTKDGGYIATCEVDVMDFSAKGIVMSENYVTMKKGEKKMLEATVLPVFSTNKEVIWSTSASYVASVNENGEVTANGTGYVEIYAKTSDGKHTATCVVIISPEVKETDNMITIGEASALQGETVEVPVKISGNANVEYLSFPLYYDDKNLTLTKVKDGDTSFEMSYTQKMLKYSPCWFSFSKNGQALEDEKEYTLFTLVFKVSLDAKSGSHPITLFAQEYGIVDEEAEDIPYNVTDGTIKTASQSEKTIVLDRESVNLNKGQTVTLKASTVGLDGVSLIWGSSDYNVAYVSNGVIKAVAPGTATITVTCSDYTVYASCTVVVTEKKEPDIRQVSIIQNGNNAEVVVEAQNIPEDAFVFFGGYSGNGKMNVAKKMVKNSDGTYSAEFVPDGEKEYKVIILESLTSMKPVCVSSSPK